MNKINDYSKFVKLEHTLFSLPIVLAGAFLAARGIPPLDKLILIILAAAGARTAAMGINRIIDRNIDSLNPRTKDRELPSGRLTLNESYAISGFGIILYLFCCYLICDLVLALSPVPLIVFIAYPYLKRFTPLCHFGVGLALALAPLGGWVAVTCSLSGLSQPILLAMFTLFWVSGFDIIYATLDEKFDTENRVFSMVSVYGRNNALRVSALCHVLAFIFLAFIYFFYFNGLFSAIVLLVTGALLFIEHRKSANVDLAFFKINILVGGAVFLFIICGIYLN